MSTRRSLPRCMVALAIAAWSPMAANSALAAKPKKKTDAPAATPAPAPAPAAPSPAKPKEPDPPPPPPPAKPTEPAKPAKPADAPKPAETPKPAEPAKPVDADKPRGPVASDVDRPEPPKPIDSVWAGFFFRFGFGYASTGGSAGPEIPTPKGILAITNSFKNDVNGLSMAAYGRERYGELVTTDVGGGMAAMLQFGYNIAGYGSFWLDINAHGNISGDKKNFNGGGGVSLLAGVHPLRFVRPDLPVDLKVYAGYTPLEVLAYNENVVQSEYKAKAWLGANHPFGLLTEWKPKIHNGFALGLDLRFVHAMYDTWYYNWDKEQYSSPNPPITVIRFEPRLTLGAHF